MSLYPTSSLHGNIMVNQHIIFFQIEEVTASGCHVKGQNRMLLSYRHKNPQNTKFRVETSPNYLKNLNKVCIYFNEVFTLSLCQD